MTQRNVVIVLKERGLQEFFRAVLDRDRDLALKFLDETVKPQVERALAPSHCRPVFELAEGRSVIGPPPPGPPTGKNPRDA